MQERRKNYVTKSTVLAIVLTVLSVLSLSSYSQDSSTSSLNIRVNHQLAECFGEYKRSLDKDTIIINLRYNSVFDSLSIATLKHERVVADSIYKALKLKGEAQSKTIDKQATKVKRLERLVGWFKKSGLAVAAGLAVKLAMLLF